MPLDGLQQAQESKAWPFVEARSLLKHPGPVVFETGYGPSGLPHQGTLAEVLRTTMVRNAFSFLGGGKSQLIVFSDDRDGMRKIPENVPQQEMLRQHLHKPLTSVPDPFGEFESFGHHNNAMLRSFLDTFGFEYTFKSATACYLSGVFDPILLEVLRHHEAIVDLIRPTLGAERQKTYSPFLPLCPDTGHVLQVPVLECYPDKGTLVYRHPTGGLRETKVTGGACKLQWKADWAMRWCAFGVHYEMHGKDLIESVALSKSIARLLGRTPPKGLTYEMFLDAQGAKVSKSKGNGLSVEEWLRYGHKESLAFFMYQKPQTAKRLFFGVIPQMMDQYQKALASFPDKNLEEKLANPLWHIHEGHPPHVSYEISFSMLINLASVCSTSDLDVLWGFVGRYVTTPHRELYEPLMAYALRYYEDFVRPYKTRRVPSPSEREALTDLMSRLEGMEKASEEDVQGVVYQVGQDHGMPLKAWFKTLYQVLLGQEHGPRMGSFIALYGVKPTCSLIRDVIVVAKEG